MLHRSLPHLPSQACMVVLTLPGHLPDVIACNLVLQLAQSMVLLAGPSTQWTEQYNETGGGTHSVCHTYRLGRVYSIHTTESVIR